MTQRFNTEESLKTRHFIEMDQIHSEQKMAELKNKNFLLAAWEKLKNCLKHKNDYLAVPEKMRKHIKLTPPLEEPLRNTQKTPTLAPNSFYYPSDPDEPQPDLDL